MSKPFETYRQYIMASFPKRCETCRHFVREQPDMSGPDICRITTMPTAWDRGTECTLWEPTSPTEAPGR